MLSILTRALLAAGKGKRPVEFVGYAASTTSSANANLSIPKPSGVAQGDLMVAIVGSNGVNTWTGDTGWTEVYDGNVTTSPRVAWKIAGPSEPGSYTFTRGASGQVVGQILAFRNAVFDTFGSLAETSGDGDLAVPEITSAGGMIAVAAISIGQVSRTHTTPSGMTATTQNFNTNSSISVFRQKVGGGPTGTRTSTMAGGSGANSGIMVGVKKA